LSSVHIAPKVRYPHNIKNNVKCPIACWDIGGADILTNAIHFSTFYFVKGKNWKLWLSDLGVNEKNVYVTGSPHYDFYEKVCDVKEFDKKYNIENKKKVLICPSNPSAHKVQFSENINVLRELIEESKKRDVKVLIKTYPNDYLFYDNEENYTGVYRRYSKNFSDLPQYENLKSIFPELEVVESQDHFEAVSHCDAMFNMSGSHISWETHFTKNQCYTSNHTNKPYYKSVNYLKNVIYPDDIYNKEIVSVQEIFSFKDVIKEENDYIERCNSIQKIVEIIKGMLYNDEL
jgi:UDP-N-acetylglucosamine 2-epimerase